MAASNEGQPSCAVEAVLVPSNEIPEDAVTVAGPSVADSSLREVVETYKRVGFQATNVGLAVEEVKAMLAWRLADDPVALNTLRQHEDIGDDVPDVRTKIFLGATSGLFLAGSREALNFLCRHRMVDVIVTPGGGIDFDILRAIRPDLVTVGQYAAPADGHAQQGNVRYKMPEARDAVVAFVVELLERLAATPAGRREATEKADGLPFTYLPSELVKLVGEALEGHDSSCLKWAAKNSVQVYSPSLVDGWFGEAVFVFNKRQKAAGALQLKVDLVRDVKNMNNEATRAKHTGMLILGGGVVKHHICNANLMRNGADHSVLIGTGQEFDGSDAGARPDEAISWGKIRPGTKPVKVYTDATVVLPLLVAEAFLPYYLTQKGYYP